ncbi:F-actin-capping protein subunit beta [Diplodia seriata]|uniref:F-actin-capping protein subunit beta n=1 Tax=Diplodia seriata TaxID=420778 RepID=A0A1S8BJ37_9PEZI|nr:F-actin-capping protein subunit beta [Diplodia seriata]
MRFSTAIVTGLCAVLATAASDSATTTSASLSPTASCLATCKDGDVTCQAQCVGTAHPDETNMNDTTECMAKCDQGDGSAAAATKFANCEQACISSYFPVGSGTAAAGTGSNTAASASATSTGSSGSSSASGSSGSSGSGSASGTAAQTAVSPSSKTTGGWDSIHVFEALDRARTAHYKLTSTVILNLGTDGNDLGSLDLSGNMVRQVEQDMPVDDDTSHVANIGKMVEDMELKMRNLLQEVYFGKAKDVVGDLRSIASLSETNRDRATHKEMISSMGGGR